MKTEGAETNFALGDIRNWTFELGSTLTGNFGNNFTMDNMTITGSDTSLTTAGTTLISNGNAKAFSGFTGMDSVTLFTESASYDKAQGMYVSDTYKLYVDGTDMKVAKLA